MNVICVEDISDAVSLRNKSVQFFHYGQFNGHHIKHSKPPLARGVWGDRLDCQRQLPILLKAPLVKGGLGGSA